MSQNYNPLSYKTLEAGATYQRPPQRLPERVTADSPATDVMTDFTKVAAMTIGPCASLEDANQRMIASGVRLLFVTGRDNEILGVITATDILGEKPMKYLQEVGGKREDIFVRDIMTPQDKLDVLCMPDVEHASVGDIVETMKRVGRQHALVVERAAGDRQIVRGMFSTKQISKQLGITIETTEVAQTFAELEAALNAA
ncbi:CBS domain-containing protein [Sulfurivermis fontis]|jgi:predicted transcriptional regulator|uniref:CBS domain-containing protein n=1 Tax=Sulfurivermis fontis TaxID=1972068 RepID=UPI000FD798DD|nr:CBS domain-containing protein [Sulfurivermis fontis]